MTFKKHQVFEVAANLTKSKQLATDLFETEQYAYRATATLLGNCNVEPYDAIILDGLDGGLSGYWTVLSVTHCFGNRAAPYVLEVELGSNALGGQTDYPTVSYRDVDEELLSGTPSEISSLSNVSFFTQLSTEEDPGVVQTTVASETFVPRSPNFGIVGNISSWRAV